LASAYKIATATRRCGSPCWKRRTHCGHQTAQFRRHSLGLYYKPLGQGRTCMAGAGDDRVRPDARIRTDLGKIIVRRGIGAAAWRGSRQRRRTASRLEPIGPERITSWSRASRDRRPARPIAASSTSSRWPEARDLIEGPAARTRSALPRGYRVRPDDFFTNVERAGGVQHPVRGQLRRPAMRPVAAWTASSAVRIVRSGRLLGADAAAAGKVRNLVYPVRPRLPFLGVHFTRMIGAGSSAAQRRLSFKREGYGRTDFDLRTRGVALVPGRGCSSPGMRYGWASTCGFLKKRLLPSCSGWSFARPGGLPSRHSGSGPGPRRNGPADDFLIEAGTAPSTS